MPAGTVIAHIRRGPVPHFHGQSRGSQHTPHGKLGIGIAFYRDRLFHDKPVVDGPVGGLQVHPEITVRMVLTRIGIGQEADDSSPRILFAPIAPSRCASPSAAVPVPVTEFPVFKHVTVKVRIRLHKAWIIQGLLRGMVFLRRVPYVEMLLVGKCPGIVLCMDKFKKGKGCYSHHHSQDSFHVELVIGFVFNGFFNLPYKGNAFPNL